jgi:dTDP-4-amino-4,6-dideoxygalactose transaminase
VLGHNYRLSEWQAAVLGVQLTRLDRQTARREEQMALLQDRLANLPGISFTRRDPRNDRRACYQLILRYDPTAFGNVHRDRFLAALQAEGIPAEGRFYVPIPDDELFPAGTLAGVGPAGTTDPDRHPFPVTAKAAYHQAIWLPHQLLLGTATDIEDIARSFEKLARHVEEIP